MVAKQKTGGIVRILQKCSQGNVLSLADQKKIAAKFDCSLRDIEKVALKHLILPARFTRNSLSCHEQLRLLQSRVAVIGCGGLGGRTAELLARLGIGHLTLTDPDIFSESNLNRQIFCTTETLAHSKVEVIADELQKINPVLGTEVHINTFDGASIAKADIVIDGLDTPTARKELAKLCQEQKIPMVHGAVKEWYGQVGVDHAENRLISTLYQRTKVSPSSPKVLAMNVALIASIQTAEAVKILLRHKSNLRKSWLQTDLRYCDFETIPIP